MPKKHGRATRIRAVIDKLPPDATFDDAIERLIFVAKIEALQRTAVRRRGCKRRASWPPSLRLVSR